MPKFTLEIEGRGAEFHIGAVSEKLFQQIKEKGIEAYINDELELGENDVGWHDLDLFSCYTPSLYDSSITVYDENYNVVDEFSGEDVQSLDVFPRYPACSPQPKTDRVPTGRKLIAVVSIYDGRWGSLELEINEKFHRNNFYFVNCDLTSMEILESDLTFIVGAAYCNSCSDEDLDRIYEQIENSKAKIKPLIKDCWVNSNNELLKNFVVAEEIDASELSLDYYGVMGFVLSENSIWEEL